MKIKQLKIFLSFFLFLLIGKVTFSQDSTFARAVIKDLSSWKYGGRGYLDSGVIKSQGYIFKKLSEMGFGVTEPKSVEIYEKKHDVIVYPGQITFTNENKEFFCGIHFIPKSSSLTTHLKVIKAIEITDKFIPTSELQTMICCIYQDKLPGKWFKSKMDSLKAIKPKGIIVFQKKLTHSISSVFDTVPVIYFIEKYANAVIGNRVSIHYHAALTEVKISNIIATIKGKENPDSILILSAHYDHLGKLGKNTYFPGANDNASGTAALLDLVRLYAINMSKGDTPRFTIRFLFFSGEEAGLLGSKDYVNFIKKEKQNIKFVFNVDLLGGGSDGATICNATLYPDYFNKFEKLFPYKLNKRGKAKNSDHYWFSESGIPSFFMYLQNKKEDAYPFYHDVYDDEKRIQLTGYYGAVKAVYDFTNLLMK